MSSRNSSQDLNQNVRSSSIIKLILLLSKTVKYTNRRRCCSCIPLLICELIFPLIIFGIIIYFSNYLINNSYKSDQTFSNKTLFGLNENEKCFRYPSKEFLNEINLLDFDINCLNNLNSIYTKIYYKTNLIIRFLNKQNDNQLFERFISKLENNKQLNNCILSKQINIIIWDHLSSDNQKDDYILFDQKNLNIIIDIDQFSSKLFDYSIIVKMPQQNIFLDKLKMKIDHSFIERHQHPSEQIDMFKMSYPPFSNLKMLIDLIGINLMLDEDLFGISLKHYSISCTEYRHHKTIPTRWSFILMELSLSITFLFYYFIIINLIIKENKEKVKQIIQIIQIEPILNYFAWALRAFAILSITTFFITVILKMSINGWIIFKYVSSFVLLLTFILLNIQLISYSILLSQLFNSFSNLFVLSIFIWITMTILSFKEFNQNFQFILCLNPYFCLIYVFRHLFVYERSMNNLNLSKRLYLWSPRLSNVYFIIFLSIPFYWIFIWYFEKVYPGEYGIGLKWNFPFQSEYWKQNKNQSTFLNRKMSDQSFKSLSSENDSNENDQIVEMKSVFKYFPQTNLPVVNNVSFNLYQNEITSLIGQNGAGKTTIMNMLCGIFSQTSGQIQICGYDTRDDMDNIRQLISYCPQHEILFDLLTVEEQIEFYAIARGYSKDKEQICSNLLQSVHLTKERNTFCQNLSGGMKRRLSIACAFIGNTKLILLDEPSSGLDPINRRLLWDWIRSMKQNRAILLSTHFMEEADALSDRIIILSNGQIRANDSPKELKTIYGNGYKLIINFNSNNNDWNLFQIIKKYLKNSSIERETSNQLIIQTNEESSDLFLQLFDQLDFLKEKNFILNYGLENTTLDEVFLRIAIDQNEQFEENENLILEDCFEVFNERLIEEGYDYYLSQYEGLFIKSILIAYRNLIFILFICLIPFLIIYFINKRKDNNQILFSFDDWSHLKEQNIFISFIQNSNDEQIFNQIKYIIKQRQPLTNIIFINNITNIIQLDYLFYINRLRDCASYSREYIGLLIENSESISILTSHLIIGYEGFSLISEYLCRGQCSTKTRLKFVQNVEEKLNDKNVLSFLKSISLFSCFYGIYPGELTLIYLLTYYLIYIYISILTITEKNQFRKLMEIFGLHPIIFWTSNYLFHLILSTFYSLFLYFVYSLNDEDISYQNNLTFEQLINKNNFQIKKKFFQFSFIISATTLPYIYLITKLIKNELIGGLLVFLILILIELFDLIRILIIIMNKGKMKMKLLYWIMNIIFPPLNSKRFISILFSSSSRDLCQLISNDKDILSRIGSFKEIKENDFNKHLFLILIEIILLFICLCLIDLNIFEKNLNKNENENENQFDEDQIDEDVLKERIYLMSKKFNLDDPFVCIDLVKKYNQKEDLSINHLTFSIHQGECFALLGFNGAGKTSLFKIIVGEERATNGYIYINGKSYQKLSDGVCRDIGYCPQYDCIQDKLTLEDYLYLFGRLKGIINSKLEQTIKSLQNLFLLNFYLNQYIIQLSGGTIRRMHAAIACLGPPNIILLDEPTTGVDPFSRRQMQKVFEYALSCDITMLLTSHSMDECQMLSSRIGIMSKGQFRCLGYIEDLRDKFGNGYSIYIKIDSDDNEQNFSDLYLYLKNQMKISINYQTESTIIFQTDQSSPAKLFYLIEQIKDHFHIQTYQIQQTNLEQIFINLQNYNF